MQRWIAILAVLGLVVVGGHAQAQTYEGCRTNPTTNTYCTYLPMLGQDRAPAAAPPIETIEPTEVAPPVTATLLVPTLTPTIAPTNTPEPTATVRPSPTATTQPTATPIPAPVRVINASSFTRNGSAYIVGEVENVTSNIVFNVRVRGHFYDIQNNLVGTIEGRTTFRAVFPGQRVSFQTSLSNAPDTILSYDVEYLSSDTTDTKTPYTVAVLTQANNPTVQGTRIQGKLRNDNGVTVPLPFVTVTFYNGAGRVIDSASFIADSDVAPGATVGYTIQTFRFIGYDHFIVQAQGYN